MLVVSGESLMDVFHAPQEGDGAIALTATAGGSPFNCAIALARLGNPTGYLCPISTDRFGDLLLQKLGEARVEVLLGTRVAAPTTLAMVTLDASRNAKYVFYREADHAFTPEGLIAALPQRTELYQVGGFIPLLPQDADAWEPVVETAARSGATISIDPNVRPLAITDKEVYLQRLDRFLDRAHLIKLSHEDLVYLRGDDDMEAGARSLLGRTQCRLVVVTAGDKGSLAMSRQGFAQAGIFVAPDRAANADTVGAGDTLMAGIVTWLRDNDALTPERLGSLSSSELAQMLRFGAVAAGINCSRAGANPPTRAEVDAAL